MRLGISAFAWTANFGQAHLNLLPKVKAMGFSAVEIPMGDPSRLPISQIRNAFQSEGIECTVCAILPKSCNPISPNSAVRAKAREHLCRCIEAAAAMGAKLLAGPLYAPIGYLPKHRPTEKEWAWAVEAFRSLRPVLDEHDMVLSIEPVNRSETFFLRTAAEAQRLCDLIGSPRVGVTIDTFHANIEERDVAAAIRSLGHNLRHIHISESDRGPLGQGHVPFPDVVSALREIGYGGYLMIEGFGYDPREKNAPGRLWAHLDVSPEDLARLSARYLQQLLSDPSS